MIRHHSLGSQGYFWAPPGGGLDYGESTHEALQREFLEETGLEIAVKRFLFVHEFLKKPLHGIELFFEVQVVGGVLKMGTDPEMTAQDQIIDQVAFRSFADILAEPAECRHHLFSYCQNSAELLAMHGHYQFLK